MAEPLQNMCISPKMASKDRVFPTPRTPMRTPCRGLAVSIMMTPGRTGSKRHSGQGCCQGLTPNSPVAKNEFSTPIRFPDFRPLPPALLGRGMVTPEAKKAKSMFTPPSGPAAQQRRLRDDIDASLQQESLSMLVLALSRSHRCSTNCSSYLVEAARRQHLRALEFLLKQNASDVDERCEGKRAIHLAIQACVREGDTGYCMAELLLRNGARPDSMEEDDSGIEPPLHNATKRGCAAAVALLLAYGADPAAVDAVGDTPLHVACRQTPFQGGEVHTEVVTTLLRSGAQPGMLDAFGNPPLSYAHEQRLRQLLIQADQRLRRCGFNVAIACLRHLTSSRLKSDIETVAEAEVEAEVQTCDYADISSTLFLTPGLSELVAQYL
eukprot:TRINITY_DN39454_c0_g1_i1.p1 TRINITY_DN39454_c0_g1~~TRINITY_DN39454_c0_g1_i1.p1  ORF type:complete len:381 (-),score=62.58 TRINITY_DN39454_c0_g1_i1:264-1406(-)